MSGNFNLLAKPEYSGFFYALLSVLLMSPIFLIVNEVTKTTKIETATTFFFVFASAATFLISTMKGRNAEIYAFARKYFKPMALAAAFNIGASVLFFTGISIIGPSIAAFFAQSTALFTIIFGSVFLKERIGTGEMTGMAITITGAVIITYAGFSSVMGASMIVASSALISLHFILLKKYVANIKPFDLNQLRLFFGALLIFSYSALSGKLSIPSFGNILLLGLGGTTAAVAGFYFMIKAMKNMDVSKVTAVRAVEPFVVLLMSALFLGSVITPKHVFGGVVMISGIIILAMAHGKHAIQKNAVPREI